MHTITRRFTAYSAAAAVAGAALLGSLWQASAGAQTAPTKGKIGPWDAMKSATGKVPGRAINANYEFEDGNWRYSVFVVAGKAIKEVGVDPMTGKAGDVESVDPDKEGREVAAELKAAISGRR